MAFVILIFAVGLGCYLWGHNAGHRLATSAVLEAVKPAPPMPVWPEEKGDRTFIDAGKGEPVGVLINLLEEQNAELLERVAHLRKDIAKLEAIIRDLWRPAPKNASINRNLFARSVAFHSETNWFCEGSR